MQKSETIGGLTKALSLVQSKLPGAKVDSKNPFFNTKYASLAAVWDACRKLLSDNGLAIIQTTSIGENHGLIVETTLSHTNGEWITGQMPMPLSKNDPQGIGSAITYGRRYGLSAILGICPDDDDDAEAATERKIAPLKTPPQKVSASTEPSSPARGTSPEKIIPAKSFENMGQFLTECVKLTNKDGKKITRGVIFEILGVKDTKDITDFNAAWTTLQKNLGKEVQLPKSKLVEVVKAAGAVEVMSQ